MRPATLPAVLVWLVACTPAIEPGIEPPRSAEPSTAEPSGIGLAPLPAPEQPSLPPTITFEPGFTGPALRTIEIIHGVHVAVVQEGSGPIVSHGQTAQLRYEGFASTDGRVVMSTRGEPTTVVLEAPSEPADLRTSMIEAVVGMRVGERRRIRVPAHVIATKTSETFEPTGDVWIALELLGYTDPHTLAKLEDFEVPPIAHELRDGGLEVFDYVAGQGIAAQADDVVEVHYLLTLSDGTSVDSTHVRAQSFAVELGGNKVIPGFDAGLVGAKPGMLRKLVIPPALAYADRDVGTIPPGSTLIFYLEVMSVTRR